MKRREFACCEEHTLAGLRHVVGMDHGQTVRVVPVQGRPDYRCVCGAPAAYTMYRVMEPEIKQ